MLLNAFAWLATRPPRDLVDDLAPLKLHLTECAEVAVPPGQRLKLFELFEQRIRETNSALKSGLIAARLPLQNRLRTIAQGLMDIHGILADNLLRCYEEIAATQPASKTWDGELIETVLGNLAEQQQIALLVATAPPAGLWTQAQAAYKLIDSTFNRSAHRHDAAVKIFERMLALAAAQPESLTARENAVVCHHLKSIISTVVIKRELPEHTDGWLWLEENRDLPPVAFSRRPPPLLGTKLYFTCQKLADLTECHLAALDEGTVSVPDFTTDTEYRDVLTRVQLRWQAPPKRQSARRTSHYRVEICAHLDRLWRQLHDMPEAIDESGGVQITQWLVLNESASGYSMMHVAGAIDDLVAGDILGVRNSPDRPWNVCLLRWGRSDNPAHIEIGLERIAPTAFPVKIAYHGEEASKLVPGLLLAVAANGDGEETLVVERGNLGAQRFTMIGDDAGRLQLTECEVDRLSLQTARVEKYKFRRDYSA